MMIDDNENVAKNGWSEYGRLVLNELKRLNEGQDTLKKDFEDKFNLLSSTISGFKGTADEVNDLKEWKSRVTEVWSPTQMKDACDQVYKLKGDNQKIVGVFIVLQIIFTIILAFKDTLF